MLAAMRGREFCDHVVDLLAPLGRVTYRSMFGGWGFYLDGLFFAVADEDVLYLKADDGNRPLYEAAGSGPFRPYPDRDATMSYYEVPAEVLDDAEALAEWARAALEAARRARAGKRRRTPGAKDRPAVRKKSAAPAGRGRAR